MLVQKNPLLQKVWVTRYAVQVQVGHPPEKRKVVLVKLQLCQAQKLLELQVQIHNSLSLRAFPAFLRHFSREVEHHSWVQVFLVHYLRVQIRVYLLEIHISVFLQVFRHISLDYRRLQCHQAGQDHFQEIIEWHRHHLERFLLQVFHPVHRLLAHIHLIL